MKNYYLFPLILFVSCSGFVPNRTFIDVMEEQQLELFTPNEDFKVIPGDSGRAYRDRTEVLQRTPASEDMLQQRDFDSRLHHELKYLESIQNEYAAQQYNQYKEKIGGISERIYFLKITTMSGRNEYLEYKGLKARDGYYAPNEYEYGARTNQLLMGMTMEEVNQSLGNPVRRDIAGNPSFKNERWAYFENGRTKFVFFENGRVEGWTQNSY